jgi:hypothetical protein
VFVCAFPLEISSIFGKSFPFPFPYFDLFILWYFPFHVVQYTHSYANHCPTEDNQNICTEPVLESVTMMSMFSLTAMPEILANLPGLDPLPPNTLMRVPSGLKIWTLEVVLSPTRIKPRRSKATHIGVWNWPCPTPIDPNSWSILPARE